MLRTGFISLNIRSNCGLFLKRWRTFGLNKWWRPFISSGYFTLSLQEGRTSIALGPSNYKKFFLPFWNRSVCHFSHHQFPLCKLYSYAFLLIYLGFILHEPFGLRDSIPDLVLTRPLVRGEGGVTIHTHLVLYSVRASVSICLISVKKGKALRACVKLVASFQAKGDKASRLAAEGSDLCLGRRATRSGHLTGIWQLIEITATDHLD